MSVSEHGRLLSSRSGLVTAALDLVDAFEASPLGPLFITTGPFLRGTNRGDGRDTARALLVVSQAIIDHVYNAPGVVRPCSVGVLGGRAWLTAVHHPGAVALPAGASGGAGSTHTVLLEAAHPQTWGHPTGYSHEDARKPTGLYLRPGGVALVNVPPSVVSAGAFKALVGAHTSDHANKDLHRRLDRVSITYALTHTSTTIASPLGGGIYLLVPYRAALGMLNVSVSGDVVEAPFFRATHYHTTTDDEWAVRRTAPAPWADFETDKFMLNVPSSWVSARASPAALLRDYNLAMDGIAEWGGYAPRLRERQGVHTAYLQPDLHIKHGAYGTG
jgi:hypothetical protein